MMRRAISYAYCDSPVGPLLVAGDDAHLLRVSFPERNGRARPEAEWRDDPEPLRETLRQLEEYFAGDRLEFSLPLHFGGEPLQVAVWKAMLEIPYGQTASYGEIAKRIGEPSAARAVGAACGANPLPVVIPCHRVVGADGSLTGFGGGLPTKRFLLTLEQRVSPQPGQQLTMFG